MKGILPSPVAERTTPSALIDAAQKRAFDMKPEGWTNVNGMPLARTAEVAGISIGSAYQYFPDKRAIFVALHERHIEQIDRIVESKLFEHAASPLGNLIRTVIEAMIDAHAPDPELYELLMTEVPHKAAGTRDFTVRLHGAFRLAISSKAHELRLHRDIDKIVFIVTHMVDSLTHGAVLRRPPRLSLAAAKEEAVRAVLAYLRA
jgi:AcrR family transcriptional regulator